MKGTSRNYSWWDNSAFSKGADLVMRMSEPYQKLGLALKEVMAAVGKMDTKSFAGKMSDIIKVFVGAGQDDSSPEVINPRRWYIESLGSAFEKMKTAIPAIVKGANSFNEKRGSAFFAALVGPTDKGKRADGYDAQRKLWNSIGFNTTKMSSSMSGIATGVNSMDLAKLTEARTMFEALGVLANGGEAEDILARMGESLEVAMQRLADILQEFQSAVETNSESNFSLNDLNPFDNGRPSEESDGSRPPQARAAGTQKVIIKNIPALARALGTVMRDS